MKRAVFLDRDGTVNEMVYNPDFGLVDSPQNPGEFKLIPGAASAIAQFNRMGLLVLVVSNQPGIAKQKFNAAILDGITSKMVDQLNEYGAHIDKIYYCLHHPQATLEELRQNCDCRKPKPGLLLRAATDLGIDLENSFMIGDGITDISAGKQANTRTIYIGTMKEYIYEEFSRKNVFPDFVVDNLSQAVPIIEKFIGYQKIRNEL